MAKVEPITTDDDSGIELSRLPKRVSFADPLTHEIPPPTLTWRERVSLACILCDNCGDFIDDSLWFSAMMIAFLSAMLTLLSVSYASTAPQSSSRNASFLPRRSTNSHKGDMTYYNVPTGREMCGYECSGPFVAVHPSWWTVFTIPEKSYPDDSICGKKIFAWTEKGNVTLEVGGLCELCKKQTDLDVSPASFHLLGDIRKGRIPVEWKWL